jgi:uncharacterized protein YgbK (DUF1537 family)
MDIGAEVFKAPFIPLLVAAPVLGRYCLFGNLFARMGIGSQGQIYRLDRHPSMSKHPVTPANESDLRLHLAKQTNKKTGLMDVLQLSEPAEQAAEKLQDLVKDGNEVVLFDGLEEKHLTLAGELIDAYASAEEPLFSVGSSGIEMALGSYWQRQNLLQLAPQWQALTPAKAILVISGSCSPVTSRQIETALQHGFAEIGIDTAAFAAGEGENLLANYIHQAANYIEQGRSVIIHTSTGNDDSRVAASHKIFTEQGLDEQAIRAQTAQVYGSALGQIAAGVIS